MAACSYLAVLFTLAIQTLCLVAIAPHDAGNSDCRTNFLYRQHHDWMPYANDSSSGTWKMLVDQFDYPNILEGLIPPPVWTSRDYDRDEKQFSQSGGGTCTYQLRLPNTFTNPDTNNWLFTQAVDYIDAVEVIVNATIRLASCTAQSECTNDFVILHRFDTNNPGDTTEAQRTDTSNYQYCFGDEQSSRLQQNSAGGETTIIMRFQRPVGSNYTYFGIQDIGTSGSIIRLFVYYEVCPRREGRLITYPEIPRPAQGSSSPITRTATCVEHAHNTTSLETRAYLDGRCEQQATCECDLGYESQNENSCHACLPGEYRSAQNSMCVACPGNSTSLLGESECNCTDGHYRAGHERIGVECTAPPTPISNCNPNELYDTGARVQWRGPSHCGGRDDCYYLIGVNDRTPIRIERVNFNRDESYTVNDLEPDTTYSITISVHNGVSDQDGANAKLRECSFIVTTLQGSVFMLRGITYRNNTAALIENIRETDFDSLKCTSAFPTCCQNPSRGNFYYPNGSEVLSLSQSSSRGGSLYRTRGSGLISLKQQMGDPAPLGRYRCAIPDGRGMMQNLYITLGTTVPVIPDNCPVPEPCNTPPPCEIPQESFPGLYFELGSTRYLNNSVVVADEVGVGTSGLYCRTNHTSCCTDSLLSFRGDFYDPSNDIVSIRGINPNLYRDRGTGYIRLNRSPSTDIPLGEYRCEILDDSGTRQKLYINIVQNQTCPPTATPPSCPTTVPVTPCPTCMECTTEPSTTCPPTVTCPEAQGVSVSFMLGGQTYPNNSVFLMSDIGEDNMALQCVTDNPNCCQNPRQGEWDYPNKTRVDTIGQGHDFYRNRGVQTVNLNRRNSAVSPTGRYRCSIPDADGVTQTLVANIIVEGESSCPPPDTSTCPTTPECTPPEPETTVPSTPCPTSDPMQCVANEPLTFQLRGTKYFNNTIVLLEDIGVGDNALWCVSNNTGCCGSSSTFRGEFHYPNGSVVPVESADHSLYRNRDTQYIRLNRQPISSNPAPLGRYRCDIVDDSGTRQWLFIDIVQNVTNGVMPTPGSLTCPPPLDCGDCPSMTPETTTCPPVPACPTPQGVGFELGGQRHPNNSVFLISDIGEGDMALLCVTERTACCSEGEWTYPNNTKVPIDSAQMDFYRNRGDQVVRLNRRNDAVSPTGQYRCSISDANGVTQTLVANIIGESECPSTSPPQTPTCPTTTESPTRPVSAIRVVAVVNGVIVMDITQTQLKDIDKFVVQILTMGQQRSKRQTTEPITFTVENSGQPWVNIPTNKLMKDSMYAVQIKFQLRNGTQGEFGLPYTFEFTGQGSASVSAGQTGQTQTGFIALAVALTFVFTAIIVTLLVLVLVWLTLTCRKKKNDKQETNDFHLSNPNYQINGKSSS